MLGSLVFLACCSASLQSEIVVSTTGSDSNPGTERLPIASLSAARDRARAAGIHAIVVRSGIYRLSRSLKLDEHDSGLTIRADRGARPQISGGIQIPISAVKPCSDNAALNRIIDADARASVVQVDLAALGIKTIPPIQPRGFPHSGITGPIELFSGDTPMTLARWPNQGYAKVGKVTEAGNGENDHDKPVRLPVFSIGDRSKAWVNAEEPWLYGYWKYDWADESIRIRNIDSTTGQITLESPAIYGVDAGMPFYAENLLEEVDAPGEYYIDRNKLRLYFIPLRPLANRDPLTLSVLDQPLISVSDAANVTIRGLDFAFSRGIAATASNCDHTRIEACRFFDLGAKAASIDGGHDCGIQSCDFWNLAEGGVSLTGGDRKTLKPARNYVVNCEFKNFERRSQTYRPAVWIEGVGNRVAHCWMHDAPHSAIIYGGNDHVIEFNRFSHLLALTGDGGVVYTGRNWTARGTTIRNNWFEDDFGQRKWEPAIYVDDLGSGIKMTGNLIERCHWGFLIGGGRDNVLRDNVLVDCDLAFDCDARGLGWAAKSRPTMEDGLKAVPYQSEIWKASYPNLPNILNENPMAPSANILEGNILIHSGIVMKQMEDPFKKTARIEGNREEASPSTADVALIKKMRSQAGLQKEGLRRSLSPRNAGKNPQPAI
jgi:hypothetical protein